MFSGANSPLNGAGLTCGVTVAVGGVVKAIGDDDAVGRAKV
jgi:hypothetical protein